MLKRIEDSTFVPEHDPNPLALMFPSMSDNEQRELKAHIAEHGLLQAIVVDADRRILDGRHRYKACVDAGVKPFFDRYLGDDPVAFVVGANLHRRDLTIDERAVVAAQALPLLEDEARRRMSKGGQGGLQGEDKSGERVPQRSRQVAAQRFGVNEKYVQRAKRLSAEAPDLAEQVRAGAIKLAKAYNQLPPTRPTASTGARPRTNRQLTKDFATGLRLLHGVLDHGDGIVRTCLEEWQDDGHEPRLDEPACRLVLERLRRELDEDWPERGVELDAERDFLSRPELEPWEEDVVA